MSLLLLFEALRTPLGEARGRRTSGPSGGVAIRDLNADGPGNDTCVILVVILDYVSTLA